MRSNSTGTLLVCSIIIQLFFATGCARGDVPLPTFPATGTFTVSPEGETSPTATLAAIDKYPLQVEFAAVWATREDGLSVRNQAGISASVAEVIPWNSHQISLTGNRSMLGSSLWLEIRTSSGTTGWVNARNLTEYFSSSQFCDDPRARSLLDEFREALRNRDDSALSQIISPNRGLSVRLNWYSPDVLFSMDEVDDIFSDARDIDWGIMADSGLQVTGSFEKLILPKLEDVFNSPSEKFCNQLRWGSTAGEVLWPVELDNLNFYAFYRPAEEGGNAFDWRTWAVGIEYIDDQPFIAILIHYSSEL
jgi:hypothetical protein